ncbi:hypothetical protein AC628_34685 [Bradyrhizobium sp. NAS96.2]|nr:hypothetical protein AC628_34685 [Bradyrhizobium sp. NAS96.2]
MGDRAIANLSEALDAKEQWATTLVLKYCLPSSRTQELHGSEPADVRTAFENGDISADEMKTISSGLEKLRAVETLEEFRERLSEIETTLTQQQSR